MTPGVRPPALIRLALRAFPHGFLAEHRTEMEEDVAEARARCSTGGARTWLTLTTSLDLLRAGVAERRAARGRRRAALAASADVRRARPPLFEAVWRDLRHAARALVRRPGFTAVAVVTLALGIGANTAIFSVVNAVLLRPLAWTDPDGLVHVWSHGAQDPAERGTMSLPDVQDVAALPGLESLVGFRTMNGTVTVGDEPDIVMTARTTTGFLETFRLRPLLGRDLTVADDDAGNPLVMVIGYRLWQDRFGGRPDIVGTPLQLSDVSYEIVGVAPPGFDFPDGAQLWVPWRLDPEGCARGCHVMDALGRIHDGTTMPALSAQLDALALRLATEHPETNTAKRFRAIRLADDQVADVRRGLWVILGAVSLVLLIACANVANLLLVRGESRRGEVAVRTALGASRSQLARQVLMESALLAAGGALLGLLLAAAAVSLVRAMPAGTVPRSEMVGLDANVLIFTLGLSVLATLLFGLSPAIRQARTMTASDMVSARRGGSGVGATRWRSLLLAAEVALSVVLLAGAGLLLKSFDRLYHVDLGFETRDLTRFNVQLPEARYDSISRVVLFHETLEAQLGALPGVLAVSSSFGPPLGASQIIASVEIEGRPAAEPGAEPVASMHSVTHSFFETMGIPLLLGRGIEPEDRAGTLPVAVVNQAFVREHFPGEDPLGRRFEMSVDMGFGSPEWTIVGVVGNVRRRPTAAHVPAVYVPLGQFGPGALTVTLRTAGRAGPGEQEIRNIVRGIDPGLPISRYGTVEQALRAEVAPTRFYSTIMGIFAALAVVLACVGLSGVVAYVVAQRGREISIRMALGARRDEVVRLVLTQGLRPASVGVVLGIVLALVLGRVLEGLLFDVRPNDPAILAAVVAVLAVVAFGAALLPARRAAGIEPAGALREQ